MASIDQPMREAVQRADGLTRTFKIDAERIGAVTRLNPRGASSVGTQSVNYMMNGLIQQFIGNIGYVINGAVVASMKQIVNQAVVAAGEQTAVAMQKLALSSREAINRKQGLARVHEEVANEAHKLVLESYENSVGSHASYRGGEGRLVGQMRQALQNPSVILAQRDGIIFGNTTILDQTAAHWRRLNFGAQGPRSTRFAQPAPLLLDGARLGGQFLRYDQGGPSPAFSMPKGFWFGGDGNLTKPGPPRSSDKFYPFNAARLQNLSNKKDNYPNALIRDFVSGGRSRTTAGIKGMFFFDAGLFYMGRTLPGRYKQVAEAWIQEGIDSASGPIYRAGLV